MLFPFSYQNAINRLHDLVMDQPMHPVDKAAWWMEYLLRHPQPEDVMRNPVLELSWWQYFLIDVFILIISVIFIFITAVKSCFKLCCLMKKTTVKSKRE